tara:strand:+ start:585 stop:770 length:186 start_codon:yes stop_codon:yes gene_type:complete
MDKLLLSVREAASLCSIGRSKAYFLIAAGVWPSVRIGKSVRVPYNSLKEWVERQVIESGSQ